MLCSGDTLGRPPVFLKRNRGGVDLEDKGGGRVDWEEEREENLWLGCNVQENNKY